MSEVVDTNVASEELAQIVEQIESLRNEKKSLSEQEKDIKSEAKSRGFDVKAINQIIKLRAANPEEVAQQETIVEVYKEALGM